MVIEMKVKKKLGGVGFENLIATLCGKKKLSDSQVNRLYDLIEELKEDDNE